ncbi:hydantoinase B/oxoprolinase family protein [Sphingomonas sp.]|uniref:hydantoinase B/oxoprolinase family protein n=1 Tax=Sphingomonas sp. TaxID=28214 RepID=UPI003D6D392C
MHGLVEQHVYTPHNNKSTGRADRADPITTQIVRNALNSAANQMKRVLIRTSFSPTIYENLDFAVAIYDRQIRMLAQGPTLPAFMGTMSFCVEGAVEAVGGETALEPGDMIIYNLPFGTGSHAQDLAIVMPVFRDGELVGYTASKGHLTDIGAKNPYCTDTIDLFQEGVIFPGVKLYRRGQLVEEIFRIILANSRAPSAVKGDILAEVACCRAGADELLRVIDRFGMQTFNDCTERMYEHGEAVVRDFIKRIPDGRHKGTGHLDNNGIDDEEIHFDVELVVEGDEITFDLSGVPDALRGPLNNPFPSTVSCCRIVLAMLAGNEAPNEGHFRPLKVITRPGSMFHPIPPQPTFMYGWGLMQLMEALFQAFAAAMPGQVPSGSAADLCGVMFWRFDDATREIQVAAAPQPIGLGAFPNADGPTMLVLSLAQSTLPSAELQETKSNFVQFDKWEFASDSGGPGKYRGGLGWNLHYRLLNDASMLTVIERTKVPSWGQEGGLPGKANQVVLHYPDGRVTPTTKVTGLDLPKGMRVEVLCGGGGGYGKPSERDPEAVLLDLKYGLVTEEKAREHYPHAFA